MASIVLDTSVVVKWFVRDEPHRDAAVALRRSIVADEVGAIAPAHLPIELASALARAARRGRFDAVAIPAAVEAIRAFEFETADIVGTAAEATRLAARVSIHPADALFIFSALLNDAVLFTADAALLEGARLAGCDARGLDEIEVAGEG